MASQQETLIGLPRAESADLERLAPGKARRIVIKVPMGSIYYFAYGSNMLVARLQHRCSSTRFVTTAVLLGYDLSFGKKSRDGSGKATIMASDRPESEVHGAVFEIGSNDLQALDRIEGRGHGYDRIELKVLASPGGTPISATTYMAEQKAVDCDPELQPYDWYLALVQKDAEQLGLPRDYQSRLGSVQAGTDPDPARKEWIDAQALLDACRA